MIPAGAPPAGITPARVWPGWQRPRRPPAADRDTRLTGGERRCLRGVPTKRPPAASGSTPMTIPEPSGMG